jgi:hypothetical protein
MSETKDRIQVLEIKVKQLGCEHSFKFKECWNRDEFDDITDPGGKFGRILYVCRKCGKTKDQYWRCFTKKEQQAMKTLNLVPNYWEVKGAKDE